MALWGLAVPASFVPVSNDFSTGAAPIGLAQSLSLALLRLIDSS